MRLAIAEAARTDPAEAAPNPRVGAALVEGDAVIALERFRRDGGPHAERQALAALGRKPRPRATLYVTLEPCSTSGRTGACVEAILQAGLARVVVGALDPTPGHQGRGLERLKAAGVATSSGCLEAECLALNPGYKGNATG